MRQVIASALIGLLVGIGVGVYLGWEQFPRTPDDSAMCQLSAEYREQYTLMVARGVNQAALLSENPEQRRQTRDAALERLVPLSANSDEICQRDSASSQIDNIPAWVQEITERYRTRGADLRDICDLAALSAAFGRQIPGYADRPGTVCDQFLPSS